jgi:hypothetical protein
MGILPFSAARLQIRLRLDSTRSNFHRKFYLRDFIDCSSSHLYIYNAQLETVRIQLQLLKRSDYGLP